MEALNPIRQIQTGIQGEATDVRPTKIQRPTRAKVPEAPDDSSNGQPVEESRTRQNVSQSILNQIGGGAIRLRIDEATQRIVAQVLDANNEVVRQIPPEAVLQLSARFAELRGALFDQSV